MAKPVVRFEPPLIYLRGAVGHHKEPEIVAWHRFDLAIKAMHMSVVKDKKLLRAAQAEVDELYEPEGIPHMVERSVREGWVPKFPDDYDERFRRGLPWR